MNGKIIKTLVKKEMLDVLRDRKTVWMMLIVPIVLYPLIFLGVMQVEAMIMSNMEEQDYRVAVSSAVQDEALWEQLRAPVEGGESAYELTLTEADDSFDYAQALNEEEIDVYVTKEMKDGKEGYLLYYLSSVTNSQYAVGIVYDKLDAYKEALRVEKVEAAGLKAEDILEPIAYEEMDIASTEQSLGSIMGMILPFMLIISLLMGTIYPAIDTTAGERERGTLETILTLPVTNQQLITSKFLTVAAIGLVSAVLNILSMGGIAFYMYSVMDLTMADGGITIAWGSFVPIIFVAILAILAFSLFISAITMCVTALAKSYKEANNYITPLMLVIMFAGYIAFIPNIELSMTMAVVPVANISLLLKNLLAFKYDYMIIATVIFSNVAYAVIAILFLSRIYDSEGILFGEGKGGMQLLEKRSNMKKGGVPNVSDAGFIIAISVLLILYVGSIIQIKFGIGGVFGTQMILLAVPLLYMVYTKKDVKATYSFHKTKPVNFLGAGLLILGAWSLVIVLSAFLALLFPQSTEATSQAFSGLFASSLPAQVLVIAITPAICEEMLFRGFLMSAMRTRYKAAASIVIVAVLFGLYHMSLVKFLPTGILGLVLCYTLYRTGSIFPTMLMHCINNLMSVLISYGPIAEKLEKWFPIFYTDEIMVSDVLLFTGAGLILCGLGLMILQRANWENGTKELEKKAEK